MAPLKCQGCALTRIANDSRRELRGGHDRTLHVQILDGGDILDNGK